MAIRKATAKNLQSHRDTAIEFHPGFNVIRGDTDSGKSAFMRGFRFCAFNKPTGDVLQSFWGGDTEFRIDLDSGEYVNRVKGKENYYDVNGNKLFSFKTDVPEEVTKVLNFTEVNLQRQLDGHFLISKTNGQIAQYFNQIAGLDKIDIANKNIKSDITKTKQRIEYNNSELENSKKELSKFEYLKKAEKVLKEIQSEEEEKQKVATEILAIDTILANIERIESKLAKPSIADCEDDLNKIIELFKERKSIESEIEELDSLIENISTAENALSEYDNILVIESDLNELLDLLRTRNSTKQILNELDEMLKYMSKLKKEQKTNKKEIVKLDKQWHENMPEICPLCDK